MALGLSAQAHAISCDIKGVLEENTPNYQQWILRQAQPYLGQRVLDVGCSTGNLTRELVDRELVVGVDPNPFALQKAEREWAAGLSNVELHEMFVPSAEFLALGEHRFDSAICSNVLEHVQNDVEALRQIQQVLQPGGTLFLLVPAHRWLYGSMDASDRHFRRYERDEVASKLARAGFRVELVRSMNLLGVAGWFVNGRILRCGLIPAKQAATFDRLVPALAAVERWLRPPVGQSIVAVGRR